MLKFYILLYKVTGFCPAFIQLRICKYAMLRLKRLEMPGYYIGYPCMALGHYIETYETRIKLNRTTIKEYLRYAVNYLEVLWKRM